MSGQIGFAGAFLGGVLTLLSPCAALLLPALFAVTYDGVSALVSRIGLFFLGLIAVLAPIGAGVAALGSLFTVHRTTVTAIGAVVIIVLGIVVLFGRGFALGPQWQGRVALAGPLSTVALGAVYGFAGFCSGPLLGAVLTVSVVSGNPLYGAGVMVTYAAGMTLPLLVLAASWDRLGPRLGAGLGSRTFALISGLALIAIGILLWVTQGTASLGSPVDTGTQLHWQSRLADWSGRLSNLEVVTGLVAVIFVVLLVRLMARRGSPERGE